MAMSMVNCTKKIYLLDCIMDIYDCTIIKILKLAAVFKMDNLVLILDNFKPPSSQGLQSQGGLGRFFPHTFILFNIMY